MLSPEEHADIVRKLEGGKQRKNLRNELKNKLHEHYLAENFPPFEPSPYFLYFINRATPTNILNQIIGTTTTTSKYIIDTESVNIFKQANKPALIQLQILLPYNLSMVLIFEMCHLPPTTEHKFRLIKQIFNIIFNDDKKIYMWGNSDELIPFTTYKLFNNDQLNLPDVKNFQLEFQETWQQNHPHRATTTTSSDPATECLCEKCIGLSPSHPWRLQNAVARQLNEWLDKRPTRSKFDVGLDPELWNMNDDKQEHRKQLTRYAANDCLAIQRLLVQHELMKSSKKSTTTTTTYYQQIKNERETTLGRIKQQQSMDLSFENNPELLIDLSTENDPDLIIDLLPENNRDVIIELYSPTVIPPVMFVETDPTAITSGINVELIHSSILSSEQKRKIHNRSCTIKQRRRNYTYEIVFHNIYKQFKIRDIKSILRRENIPFVAVNTSTSSITSKCSLYVGIQHDNKNKLEEHRIRTKDFFTYEHYISIQDDKRRTTDHRHHRFK